MPSIGTTPSTNSAHQASKIAELQWKLSELIVQELQPGHIVHLENLEMYKI